MNKILNIKQRYLKFNGNLCMLFTLFLMIISFSNIYANPNSSNGYKANVSEIGGGDEINEFQSSITGTVKDAAGLPLPNVNVIVVGTNSGSQTDFDGNYSILASSGDVLEFSFVGMKTIQITVGDSNVVDLSMEEDANALDEVVVTALGLERNKKSLAYSVTQVEGDELALARDPNAINALQGKVAGVNISKPNTGPGGSTRVVIRGNTSLTGNNQPLYVIDGVPIDNGNLGSAGQWGGNDAGDGISSLNPDDIESMSVLKGASAAALYGSRASNGVILVTTKSGSKNQGVSVEFNSNFVVEDVVNLTDWQKSYGMGANGEKPTTQIEASNYGSQSWGDQLDGSSVIQFDGESRPYSYAGDAVDEFYNTGTSWTNSLSVSSGGEKANFRISASDLSSEAVMPNSDLNRQTFNMNASAKLGDFTASLAGTYTVQRVQNAPNVSDIVFNANTSVLVWPTSLNIKALQGDPNKIGADPETGGEYLGSNSVWWGNPYWSAYQIDRDYKKNRINGNFSLKYDITDWLYALGRVGTDYYSFRQESIIPTGHGFRPAGSYGKNWRDFNETNFDFIVGANKEFDFGLGLDILAGGNQMTRDSESVNLGGSNFAIPFFHVYSNLENQSSSTGLSKSQVNSLYYQVELAYKSFYLTTTGRQDWFSTLDGRGIFYPSVGLSAVLSDMFDSELFDYLKVRGAWGEVGGATNPYATRFTYTLASPHNGYAQGRIANSSVPNQFLVPLVATEIEFGLEARFLKARLSVDFAYYDRKTEQDILNATVVPSSGYSGTTVNIGEVTNKGVELLLSGTPILQDNFTWKSSFNLGYNKSEVVDLLDPDIDDEFVQTNASRTLAAYTRNIEGLPYGQIVGYKYARDAGGNIIVDDNGLPTRNNELVPFGSGIPTTTGGWLNNFSYKSWNLSFLIDYQFGGYVHSGTNTVAYQRGLHKNTLVGRESGIGSVAPEDVQDYYGRIGSQISEDFIYKSDFIKFRELSFGYNFGGDEWLDGTPINGMTLSLVGRNLFIIHKESDNIDPESSFNQGNGQGLEYGSLPTTRTIGLNLNIKF